MVRIDLLLTLNIRCKFHADPFQSTGHTELEACCEHGRYLDNWLSATKSLWFFFFFFWYTLSFFFKYSNMRAWRPEFSMWLEFAWLAHLPAERNTSSLYGDRRSIWCIACPLRKCVHQCKQRKFTPAPQISVYSGATTLGCGVGLIFFTIFFLSLSMCVSLTESLFSTW